MLFGASPRTAIPLVVRPLVRRGLAGLCVSTLLALLADARAAFTRLTPLLPPEPVAASEAHASGHTPRHLVDGDPASLYVSNYKGLETFVEFDFGRTVPLAAFRHVERPTNATVAESELICLDERGTEVGRIRVTHRAQPNAVTTQVISPVVSARRVRWHVTKLGNPRSTAVGGAEIAFFAPGDAEPEPRGMTVTTLPLPIARRTDAGALQLLRLGLDYPYAEPFEGTVAVGGRPPQPVHLRAGPQTIDVLLPVAPTERSWSVVIADAAGREIVRRTERLPAFREMTLYILPHSHVDIGYTEIQTDIEEKQVNNLFAGIDAAERTAANPPGARFVWNLENTWPMELFLRRADPGQRERFLRALKEGRVAINGIYANMLTGLSRPEELLRVFKLGTELRTLTGATVDSAMISDVPGYTWGSVTAMSQAGIRYFSPAPNNFDRIGDILVQWENRPFWWIGPSGHERVLVWVPTRGYALSHNIGRLSAQWLDEYAEQLVRGGYPYSVAYIRWSGHGDNAVPDPAICDFVRDWNAANVSPRLVIGSTHDAFNDLEHKYGAQLPEFRGDWTPYWEDGAGSSALETAMNRATSDRLAQAEALWALAQPRSYPARDFAEAMKHVLLYHEHTWGASRSVSVPTHRTTVEQWSIKHGYAATADALSRDLMGRALELATPPGVALAGVDIWNTSSWTRTGLVTLPRDMSPGDLVSDTDGRPVPSQRNSLGELVVLARDVPAFGARRYLISAGKPQREGAVTVQGSTLDNGIVRVTIDPVTGGIVELRLKGIAANLVDTASGQALNEYLYFNGDDVSQARRNDRVSIRVKEKGPLFASLLVESAAPGCHALAREVRLVAGSDQVEIENFVDKQRLVAESYRAPEGKESMNFGFPFNVPGGQVRLEVPYGVIRPDADQIPGSCKNWFTVDRWADVSNAQFGVTWVSPDAPLVQVGGLTANLLNSQTNPGVWRKHVGETQKLYAWVMNNHWGTNYRAYQEGPHTFRFILRPHAAYDPAAASRLAIAASQPLLVTRARGAAPGQPLLRIDSPDVIVTGLKPSDDGRALVVRLWAAAGRDVTARISGIAPGEPRLALSDTSEQALRPVGDSITIPAWGVASVRLALP